MSDHTEQHSDKITVISTIVTSEMPISDIGRYEREATRKANVRKLRSKGFVFQGESKIIYKKPGENTEHTMCFTVLEDLGTNRTIGFYTNHDNIKGEIDLESFDDIYLLASKAWPYLFPQIQFPDKEDFIRGSWTDLLFLQRSEA